jgi:hypothetical protein
MFMSKVPLLTIFPRATREFPPFPAVLNVPPLSTVIVPATVTVRLVVLFPTVSVPLTVRLARLLVFVSTVTVCVAAIITSSPFAGTPEGDHVPAVLQAPVPVEVFVAAFAVAEEHKRIAAATRLRTIVSRVLWAGSTERWEIDFRKGRFIVTVYVLS